MNMKKWNEETYFNPLKMTKWIKIINKKTHLNIPEEGYLLQLKKLKLKSKCLASFQAKIQFNV